MLRRRRVPPPVWSVCLRPDVTAGVRLVGVALQGLVGLERQIPLDSKSTWAAQIAEFCETHIAALGRAESQVAEAEGNVLIIG